MGSALACEGARPPAPAPVYSGPSPIIPAVPHPAASLPTPQELARAVRGHSSAGASSSASSALANAARIGGAASLRPGGAGASVSAPTSTPTKPSVNGQDKDIARLDREKSYAGKNAGPPVALAVKADQSSESSSSEAVPPPMNRLRTASEVHAIRTASDAVRDDIQEEDEEDNDDGDDAEKDFVMQRLREQFDKFDTDKSGFLDYAELEGVIRGIYEPSEEEINDFLKKFDQNSDGEISLSEFKTAMRRLKRTGPKITEKHLEAMFKQFDVNGDGSINGDELRHVAREALEISPELKRKVIKMFDANHDKTVSFDEFAKVIGKVHVKSVKKNKLGQRTLTLATVGTDQ